MKNLILVVIGAMLMFSCKKDIDRELPSTASKASVREDKLFTVPTIIPKYNGVMVKFKNNSQRTSIARMNAEFVRTKAMERSNYNGYYLVKTENVEQELSRLKASGEVQWVSPNWTEKILDFQPNDPYYVSGDMYGLSAINVQAAWNSGNFGKEDVYVVVIDEGSMYWHCDLNGKVWVNQEELNGIAGVDDDGNGYVDDVHGWNWFDGTNEIYTGNNDHATHCEGTIAAKGNNGIGVIGIAPNVKTISLKFLSDYGFDNDAIKAIDYAIDLKVRKGLNIKIMSNSWGGGGFNQGLMDAIDRAKAADILFVAAAGNSNNNNDLNGAPSYPSSYPNENIIAVGATDWGNAKASFSSYGKTTVDLFAPGVGIWSTLPTADHTSGYGAYSGTSMATPHVSGALALLTSVHPEYTWSQLKSTILSSVTPLAGLTNLCVSGGLLNVSSFTGVTTPVIPNAICGTPPPMDMTPPPVPQNLRATDKAIGDPNYGNYIRLQWDTTGFFETYGYNIWMKKGSGSFQWIGSVFGNWAVRIQGLELNTYDFYIVGRSRFGALSAPSNTITVDLNDPFNDTEPPSIPQNLRASDIGELQFRLTWDASTDNHTTPSYRVNWRKVGNVDWGMATTSNTTFVVNQFTEPNSTYDCKVEARDAAGNYSAASQVIQVTTGGSEPPPPPPPPPPTCTINSTLNATSQSLNVAVTFSASTNCTIQSKRLERKKGSGSYQTISTNPGSPYNDIVPNPGNYTYRLVVTLTSGQVGYSNEKTIKVNKK